MTFCCGSGSCYFRPQPSRGQKKLIFYKVFLLITFWRYIEVQKKSQNSRKQGFSYYVCLMIEGSRSGSGSIPLTSGSGSGRPKNMWIRWIQIRIRIRNTALVKIGWHAPAIFFCLVYSKLSLVYWRLFTQRLSCKKSQLFPIKIILIFTATLFEAHFQVSQSDLSNFRIVP
jgi:hypothetical protein